MRNNRREKMEKLFGEIERRKRGKKGLREKGRRMGKKKTIKGNVKERK